MAQGIPESPATEHNKSDCLIGSGSFLLGACDLLPQLAIACLSSPCSRARGRSQVAHSSGSVPPLTFAALHSIHNRSRGNRLHPNAGQRHDRRHLLHMVALGLNTDCRNAVYSGGMRSPKPKVASTKPPKRFAHLSASHLALPTLRS
jgi:hypothetical protein